MKKINYILLSLLFVAAFSCTKDELNRNFKEFDDVTIEGLQKIYNVQLGDNLKITPTITTRFGSSEDDYEYLWYKYNLTIQSKADTIGHELILDTQIFNVQSGIPHYITLKVINKKDGTFTLAKAELNVTGEFSGGVMMLTKTDNELDLAFIKNDTEELKNNLYSSANNGQKLPVTSNRLFCNDPFPKKPNDYKRLIIATNDENIGLCLSHDGFVPIEKLRDKFLTEFPVVEDYQLYSVCNSRANEFIMVGGKLYDRMDPMGAGSPPPFNTEVLCLTKPWDFELAPIVLPTAQLGGEPVVYDNKHGRFMYKTMYGTSYSFFQNNSSGTYFQYFNPGKLQGMKMLCAGYYDSKTNNMWILMDDQNTGNRRLLKMIYGISNVGAFKSQSNQEITREMAPKMYEAKKFKSTSEAFVAGINPWMEVLEGIGNAFVYLVGNKLYLYNIESNYEGVIVDGDKEGFTIDDVFVNETFFLNAEGGKDKFTRIALAIRDNSASGKRGGIAYYKVQFLGGISATQYFKEVGFCDQVISLDEKPT